MKDNALNYYLGKNSQPRKNCAESVSAAYENKYGELPTSLTNKFQRAGGGNAPEGLCGACYAAQEISKFKNHSESENFLSEFTSVIQNSTCMAIKSSRSASCLDCVKTAADLLDKQLTPERIAGL